MDAAGEEARALGASVRSATRAALSEVAALVADQFDALQGSLEAAAQAREQVHAPASLGCGRQASAAVRRRRRPAVS